MDSAATTGDGVTDGEEGWPRPMETVAGPFAPPKIDGALDGMGDYGTATRAIGATGVLQPDLITGMTLYLIARQPRRPRSDGSKKSNGVSGGVWVREQFTIHRPIDRTDAFAVSGASTGTFARKGRRYSTTASSSHTSTGDLFATNLTTGLLTYRPDPTLPDSSEGLPLEQTPAPEPDWQMAANNPHADTIRALSPGQKLGGERVLMSLAMMVARDTDNPDNPIHSDPEEAKKTGLARPIAGGSHVLSMPLETIMAACGPASLLHGAHFDVRWKVPTEDGVTVVPSAVVTEATADRVVFDIKVQLHDGPDAMVATVTIPLTS